MRNQPLNRIVAIAAVICSLVLAIVPVVANFDWTSTAGVLGGIVAIASVTLKWLEGWQKYENHPYHSPMPEQFRADPTDTKTHPHGSQETDLDADVMPNG